MPSNDRNKLIEENVRLVGQVIKDKVRNVSRIGIYTYDDLFQIGCIGLCKAADTFRPGKSLFSTYAYILIRNEIMDALEYATLRRNRETLTEPAELSAKATPEFPDGTLHALRQTLDAAYTQTSGVTAKGIEAIRMLAEGYTHREIGERMGGVTANNVTAWVARARKYLRNQPDITKLGDFL